MAKKKDRETTQDRKFCCVLYPDSTDYDCNEVLSEIETINEFAYILHDRDTDDNGIPLKPHYHCVFRFKNPRYIKTVARKIRINPEKCDMIQFCDSFVGYERYLIHETHDSHGKALYDAHDVVTNIPTYLSDVGARTESMIMQEIDALIECGTRSAHMIRKWAYANDAYDVVRRNWSIIVSYCEYCNNKDDNRPASMSDPDRAPFDGIPSCMVDMSIIHEMLNNI